MTTTLAPDTAATDTGAVTPATATPAPATRATTSTTWTERTVEAITRRLSSTKLGRRSFLTRAALIGSALAVDPIGFLIKPQSAWASVCGLENECNQGWSAFCATINDGANTCPSGSYAAGWWKIDNTTFCSGRARYIVDCNRSPGASCSCRCANGDCDRRRVCCNNFRYGQCNTQVRGTTEVVCRIVLCTPPWEWGNCTTTSATSNGTRTHWSSRLPSRTDPTPITVTWLELGLTGSVLGDMVGVERDGLRGGTWAVFDNGAMGSRGNSTHYVTGPHGDAYVDRSGAEGPLGYPVRDTTGNPRAVRYDTGSTYRAGNDVWAMDDGIDDYYRAWGEQSGWMGAPTDHAGPLPGPWRAGPTASDWWVVHNTDDGDTRPMRSIEQLDPDGVWPKTAVARRTAGDNRWDTAAAVSQETHPSGADTVFVVGDGRSIHTHGVPAAAAHLDAPILFVRQGSIPSETRDEIQRLDPQRIIAVGTGVDINRRVYAQLGDLAPSVERWADRRRIITAVEVSRNAFASADDVVLTNDQSHRLAMTSAPLAASLSAPTLITATSRLLPVVAQEIDRLGANRVTIVGNPDSVSNAVVVDLEDRGLDVRRVSGSSDLTTTANVYNLIPSARIVVTEGDAFSNLVSAASLAVRRPLPILLVNENSIPNPTDQKILWRRPDIIKIVGHDRSVSHGVGEALKGYPAV